MKRQKNIKRRLSKPSPICGCQVSILDLPGSKSLLESTYECLGTCGCPSTCGCQNIFLEELPCRCNSCDGYGVLNAEVSCYDRIPAIRLPKTLASIDARIPVPAINLPTLCQCDIPSCQCQNARPYQTIDSPCSKRPIYEYLNPIDVTSPIIKMPADMFQTVIIETPRPVMKLANCGCQLPVEVCGCQRQQCGCLSALDIPCSCQVSTLGSPCGCQLSALDMPCRCQLPALNLPCGYQLPSLDCGCQIQAFNSPCCQSVGTPCGLAGQLPVPNVPYAYLLPSADLPCAYQLPVGDIPCNCQLPGCGCQSTPPVGGCGKYLRQVTLQPPFL